jgi:hypothetical protein
MSRRVPSGDPAQTSMRDTQSTASGKGGLNASISPIETTRFRRRRPVGGCGGSRDNEVMSHHRRGRTASERVGFFLARVPSQPSMNGSLSILLADGIYIGGGVILVVLIILVVLLLMRRGV